MEENLVQCDKYENMSTYFFFMMRLRCLELANHAKKQAEVQQCLAQLFGSVRATTIPILGLVWPVLVWSGLSWPGLAYPDMALTLPRAARSGLILSSLAWPSLV